MTKVKPPFKTGDIVEWVVADLGLLSAKVTEFIVYHGDAAIVRKVKRKGAGWLIDVDYHGERGVGFHPDWFRLSKRQVLKNYFHG